MLFVPQYFKLKRSPSVWMWSTLRKWRTPGLCKMDALYTVTSNSNYWKRLSNSAINKKRSCNLFEHTVYRNLPGFLKLQVNGHGSYAVNVYTDRRARTVSAQEDFPSCITMQSWCRHGLNSFTEPAGVEFLPLKLVTKEEPQETSALVASCFFPLWSGKFRYSNSNHS